MWAWLGIALAAALLAGSSAQAGYYPASPGCSSRVVVDQTTSTDILTLTNNGYICAIHLQSSTAQNVSVIQGTGTVCATNAVVLDGGTTTTPHLAMAASGGFVLSLGSGNFLKTTTTAQHLCVLQSSTGQVSGVIIYTDAP